MQDNYKFRLTFFFNYMMLSTCFVQKCVWNLLFELIRNTHIVCRYLCFYENISTWLVILIYHFHLVVTVKKYDTRTERYYFLPKIWQNLTSAEIARCEWRVPCDFMNCVHALHKTCCNNLSWIDKMCIFLINKAMWK